MKLKMSEKNSELLYDLYASGLAGVKLAKEYGYSEGRISQLRKQLRFLKHPPKIKEGKLACYLCGSFEHLKIHLNEAVLCPSCTFKYNSQEDNFDWKEGFKELYSFFESVMRIQDKIIKDHPKWNSLLQKRNLILIDKLGGEL